MTHAANAKSLGMLPSQLYIGFHTYQLQSIARYLSVLQMIYEAIAYKIVVTKRDIYYREVSIFGSQQVVDSVRVGFRYISPSLGYNILIVYVNRWLMIFRVITMCRGRH